MRLSRKGTVEPGTILLVFAILAGLLLPYRTATGFELSKTIHAKDYGVIGDGITDDGPAIRRAVSAAIAAGPGASLVFEPKTYRMDAYERTDYHIALDRVEGLTIDGNGSTLLLHPSNGVLKLSKCKNVDFKGFVVNFSPLPFTQGTINSIDASSGYFDLEVHENYPVPPSDALVKELLGEGGWRWGSVIDPTERHRRWDVSMHYFIASVNKIGERTYRVLVTDSFADDLIPVVPGDRFFLPLMITDDGTSITGTNFTVRESSDCTIEDVTIHTARSGMNFGIARNEGVITLRNNSIKFEEGSTHICTTWKDGIHCKDNRTGPVIEHFYFEGMLDDAINISANTAMATTVHSTTQFTLMGPVFSPGDKVMVFDPVSGEIVAETKVLYKSLNKITLADAVPGVIPGNKTPDDIRSTHFYNVSYVNTCFVIRNCTFKPQRRHAMLIRSCNGLIEENTIDGVGGSAVWMGNEMGNFYEGPFPQYNTIRNNIIRNTQTHAINIYSSALGGSARHTKHIKVVNNTITLLPDRAGIRVSRAENVELTENYIFDHQGNEIGDEGIIINQ